MEENYNYNVVLVSAVQQCKSAIIIHVSPTSFFFLQNSKYLFFNINLFMDSCWCIAKSIQYYTVISIPYLLSVPPTPSQSSRSSQSTRLGSLLYITTSHRLSILYTIVYICWSCFLYSSPTVSTSLYSTSASPFLPCK